MIKESISQSITISPRRSESMAAVPTKAEKITFNYILFSYLTIFYKYLPILQVNCSSQFYNR